MQPTVSGTKGNRKKRRREEWEIEDDVRSLGRAEEIKKDPARLAEAKAMAVTKLERLKSIGTIKAK